MFERQSDPAIDSVLVRAPVRTDQKNSFHRTFRKVARADVWAPERRERGLGAKADHQFLLAHAATHITGDHNGETAEHRLLGHVWAGGKRPPYPGGEGFAVGHSPTTGACSSRAFSRSAAKLRPHGPTRSRLKCRPPSGAGNERGRRG